MQKFTKTNKHRRFRKKHDILNFHHRHFGKKYGTFLKCL